MSISREVLALISKASQVARPSQKVVTTDEFKDVADSQVLLLLRLVPVEVSEVLARPPLTFFALHPDAVENPDRPLLLKILLIHLFDALFAQTHQVFPD